MEYNSEIYMFASVTSDFICMARNSDSSFNPSNWERLLMNGNASFNIHSKFSDYINKLRDHMYFVTDEQESGTDVSIMSINPRYHDRYQIYTLTDKEIEIWRKEDKNRDKENRKRAAEKASKTRKENKIKREDFKKYWKKQLEEWHKIDEKLAAAFELSYWTMWLSRDMRKKISSKL